MALSLEKVAPGAGHLGEWCWYFSQTEKQPLQSDRTEIENLIARVAMKDRVAFDQLYDRVSAKLFGVCLELCANLGDG